MKIGAQVAASVPPASAATAAAASKDAKLRKASQQLEGAFVQQMYKSMRETIPDGGMFDGGSGEQMFTGMMDEHVAADTPLKWQHGLSEAIYRQLRGAMSGANAGTSHQQQQVASASAASTSDAATSASTAAATLGLK